MLRIHAALAVLVVVVAPLMVAVSAQAAPAPAAGAKVPDGKELTAEDIMQKALDKGTVGFKQGTATLKMTIVTAKGEAKERTLDIEAMRGDDGLTKSMVKFTKPADVNGTAFLVIQKKDALPDQYVYTPKGKVVRRIAAGNASSTFFGSDFTYGDLMPLPVSDKDKLAATRGDDADIGGQPVYVITVTPKIDGAPYGKVVAYVHKEFLVPLKIEFFDTAGKPLKTLRVRKLQKVNNEQVPVDVEMTAVSGSRTELEIEKIDPNAKLTEGDFTEEAMQR
ncbi:MAG TPA: outer membrane lipoprotein-sorting protein [Myxococcota bacterium]